MQPRSGAYAIVVLVLITSFALSAECEDFNSLDSLVQTILRRNPGLKSAIAQVQEAEGGLRQARAERLPSLSARSQWTRGDNPVYAFGSLLEQGRFGPNNFAIDSLNHPSDLSNIKSGLDLGLPIFTGFELTSAARRRELALRTAQSGEEGRKQRLRHQTSQLYLQLLLDAALMKNMDDRIAASAQELDEAEKLKRKGYVLGSDYFAADAILSGLRSWKVQVQTDRAAAAAQLAVLAGRADAQAQGALADHIYAIPTLDELTARALAHRPDFAAAGSELAAAEADRRQAGRSILPQVRAFASLETNTNDFSSNPSNHLYGVAARLPIGDPAYFSRRAQALSRQEAARQSHADLEETVRADVAQAYAAYQGAVANRAVTQEALDRSGKSLALFRPLYRSGRQSILEVLRAEEGLAKAQAAYLQVLFQNHAAYLDLKAAAGELDDKTIAEVSKQLESKP